MFRRAVLLALLLLGAAVPAHAAPAGPADPAVTWQIQPSTPDGPTTRPYFVYDLDPGGTVADHVGVTNLGATPLTLDVYPADAYNASDGAFDVRTAAVRPTDVGGWVTLAQRRITIAPRTRADIPFTLTVPREATPGDHAGGIVAAVTSTTTDSTGASVSVERRIGTRLYLRVGGQVTAGLGVSDVRTSYDASANPLGQGAAVVRYVVTNTGNTRLAAHSQVRVAGPFGLLSRSVSSEVPELLPGGSVEQTVRVPARALVRLAAGVSLDPYVVVDPAVTTSAPEPADVSAKAGLWALAWWHLPLGAVLAWLVSLLVRRLRRRSRPSAADEKVPAEVGAS